MGRGSVSGSIPRGALRATFLLGLGAALVPACRPSPGAAPHPDDPALDPAAPDPGPVLSAVVPLADGGALDLAALRGRMVLLELATPGDATSRLERYDTLARAHADDLVVIVVAVPERPGSTAPRWDLDHRVTVGWDPQGALPLRLGVARLPQAWILDRQGRAVHVFERDALGDGTRVVADLRDALASR